MTNDKATSLKQLVEQIGVVIEKAGLQPAAGRVIGCLLVSDPPHKTFDEIQQYLGISKSAVSNALNGLMSQGIVDYITKSGDRKRYFQLAVSGWISLVKRQMGIRSSISEILRDVLAARSNKYPDFNRTLKGMIEFYVFMEKERQASLQKWERMKGRREDQ